MTVTGNTNDETPWTVVGAYPPGGGSCLRDNTFIDIVEAASSTEAGGKAVAARTEDTHFEPDDIAVLAVFAGGHSDVWKG